MLLKLATARASGAPVREAAAQIASYGQKHITHATEILRERRRQQAERAAPPCPPPVRDSSPSFAAPPTR
jgi:hypothetical protein